MVRAFESLETVDSKGPFETTAAWVLLKVCQRKLRGVGAETPSWVAEEILGASGWTGDARPLQWIGRN
jgi:hypothetical protein